jgi:hypothetical protein
MKDLVIFDLDQTVICSKHRQLTREDGSLDLAHWIENCTREKILADSLLPLAELWYVVQAQALQYTIAVLTARVIGEHDLDFLAKNNLLFDYFFSRDGDTDTRRDSDLKRDKLVPFLSELKPRRTFLLDDNDGVLAMAASLGLVALDSKIINHDLKNARISLGSILK